MSCIPPSKHIRRHQPTPTLSPRAQVATKQDKGLWVVKPELSAMYELPSEVPEAAIKALEAKAAVDSSKRVRRPPARHAAFYEDAAPAPQQNMQVTVVGDSKQGFSPSLACIRPGPRSC